MIKWKDFTCECGTASCKYSEAMIQTTLKQYYLRIREEQMDDDSSGYQSDVTKTSDMNGHI